VQHLDKLAGLLILEHEEVVMLCEFGGSGEVPERSLL